MALKDLNAFLTFVYATDTAAQLFRPNSYPKKCRPTKYRQIL